MDDTGVSGGALAATGLFCGSCGTELPPNSKFCNECGTPLTQSTQSAEYKQVTVLFADVVRSTDVAAAVDIERLREIMTELVQRSAAVAQRYGGTVEYTGDGVMALFGAPMALEDHAFRACLAALAVQEETNRLAAEVLAMGRSTDAVSYAGVVALGYVGGIPFGVLRPDDSAVREIEEALRIVERSADDFAVAITRATLGLALVHRDTAAERDRGQQLLAEVGDVFVRRGYALGELPAVNVYLARERARRDDRDEAIPLMRAAVDHLFREEWLLWWGPAATGVLVETLLDRGADGDVAEAEAAIIRLADAPADDELVIRDIWLLLLRALLARAHGDDTAYRDYRDRYRTLATSLGFEGHMEWAEAMP